MGPHVYLILGFAIYCVCVTFAVWAIINFLVSRLQYRGPEDDELWNLENHFTVTSDDPHKEDIALIEYVEEVDDKDYKGL